MPQQPQQPLSFRDHALAYGCAGWLVFPVKPREKRPLTRHGVKDASSDPNTIREWWNRWPYANIGLAVPAGLMVLDIDSSGALAAIKGEGLALPETACARTANGWHLWYSTGETVLGNRVGIRPGVDIRGRDGYVVAPPSIHPSGRVYRWQIDLDRSAIAPAPDWVVDAALRGAPNPGKPAGAVRDWHRRISNTVGAGRRNQTLAEIAGLLFRSLPAEEASELAWCWSQVMLRPPLSENEVRRTIDSIAGLELKNRGLKSRGLP